MLPKHVRLSRCLNQCVSYLKSIAFPFEARQAYLTRMSVSGTTVRGPFFQQQPGRLLNIVHPVLHGTVLAEPDAHGWAEPYRSHALERGEGRRVP